MYGKAGRVIRMPRLERQSPFFSVFFRRRFFLLLAFAAAGDGCRASDAASNAKPQVAAKVTATCARAESWRSVFIA
jgi:hypothetical protein